MKVFDDITYLYFLIINTADYLYTLTSTISGSITLLFCYCCCRKCLI